MSFTIEKEVVVYIVFNFGLIEGKPVDPLAESLDCSQAKKVGPRYISHSLIATKKIIKLLLHNLLIMLNVGPLNGFHYLSTGNRQPLISKASNNGTLINLTSPHKHFEMINSINQMDQNVNVINNLLRAAQGETSVTLHDLGVNNFLFL
ncbi:uncharacterized protein LOC124351031 isoform X2 [Daphnia pulicaria]|uniref:uncharacterized protein LOC124351031 isoform X2 n=1 Tax=Daphnia pulicaria TaxID=35523 RepID=UPI001EEC3385|nr:uncharacterized protein LOC124351031 isoform X2 [Daphnia pulicaria]